MDNSNSVPIGENGEYESAPAYDCFAWNIAGSTGPQCSVSGEFCFFCTFQEASENIEDGEEDDCESLKSMVRSLARERKELPIIVNNIYKIYEKHIRNQTEYTHPLTNMNIKKPKWSKTSIQRHLMYSREFPDLFDGIVEQVFHSIISSQQDRVMEKNTGAVIEARRQSLMDSVNNFSRWRLMQNKLDGNSNTKSKKIQ